MKVYDRSLKEYVIEEEYGTKILDFLYNSFLGRLLLKFVIHPNFSIWRGTYYKSRRSRKDIRPFCEKYGIVDKMTSYNSFNDFFIRGGSFISSKSKNELVAPADSKLSVYSISDDLKVTIKNVSYSLSELVQDAWLVNKYKGGYCLVYRLSLHNNHNYYFTDSGIYKDRFRINGVLHTIRPVSEKFKSFVSNQREVSILKYDTFGDVIQIEVGALLTGSVVNKDKYYFIRGEKKGYFEFGGSTIVMLFKDNIVLDSDIVEQSNLGVEVKVSAGEKIGLLKGDN